MITLLCITNHECCQYERDLEMPVYIYGILVPASESFLSENMMKYNYKRNSIQHTSKTGLRHGRL